MICSSSAPSSVGSSCASVLVSDGAGVLALRGEWVGGVCHETTARAARLEQGVLVALKRIWFSELRGTPVFRHGVVSAVATPLQEKGQKDGVRGGA